eukprot:14520787-Alexandrium_andersonii.AAC.1
MSASLVGSEMCIRDSCANSAAESTPPELQGPVLRLFLGPRSSWFEPVSYTHLTLPTICSV